LQAALVQINEGLYFRNPRLATRFEFQCRQSTSKSTVKLNYKIQYPRNSGSKKQSRSYFLRFFFKNSSSKYQKRFAIAGYTTMLFAANCLVSFLYGCADNSPEIAKFIGKCAENVIA